jgi:mannitol/fructose-specific phosphotransferase system IIA component (Ntr-type)
MLHELVKAALIQVALEPDDKAAALRGLLATIAKAGRVKKKDLADLEESLFAREELGSTGIGNGIAVPHLKSDRVAAMCMAVARLPSGVDYQAIDGRPVHGIFLIITPQKASEDHLRALRWVSSLARSADFRRFLAGAETEAQIRDLLAEMLP